MYKPNLSVVCREVQWQLGWALDMSFKVQKYPIWTTGLDCFVDILSD